MTTASQSKETYILLGQFTDQGVGNVVDTSKRADAAKELAKKGGARVRDLFWTIGLEAPDDETMVTFGLSGGKLGNVRPRSTRF